MAYYAGVAATGFAATTPQLEERPEYLSSQLITYIGNKRALLGFIGQGVEAVRARLGGRRLRCFDAFSGSGVVGRYLKRHAASLAANDLEPYALAMNRCYLRDEDEFPAAEYRDAKAAFAESVARDGLRPGPIAEHYAPADDRDIKPGERVFYTARNARFIDSARAFAAGLPERLQPYFVAPLLAEASVHANTAGVFKGFYKDAATGIGRFGGRKQDALGRITGDIGLPEPVFSRFACPVELHQGDAELVARRLGELDLAYLDPPYNQHPYGSNYFMLNLIAGQCRPLRPSPVSGIPADWNRSDYNRPHRAAAALRGLVDALPARFVLVSFNSEGFIALEQMRALLGDFGAVSHWETRYNAFRGSRNLGGRARHVNEYLFLLEKA